MKEVICIKKNAWVVKTYDGDVVRVPPIVPAYDEICYVVGEQREFYLLVGYERQLLAKKNFVDLPSIEKLYEASEEKICL